MKRMSRLGPVAVKSLRFSVLLITLSCPCSVGRGWQSHLRMSSRQFWPAVVLRCVTNELCGSRGPCLHGQASQNPPEMRSSTSFVKSVLSSCPTGHRWEQCVPIHPSGGQLGCNGCNPCCIAERLKSLPTSIPWLCALYLRLCKDRKHQGLRQEEYKDNNRASELSSL